ncbi:MAG: hypothetical protein E7Z92_00495 [Cyanobacteria bacterium SIG31]|nr:hypothetical protein [Cyanobacteria bacterium SIG31]
MSKIPIFVSRLFTFKEKFNIFKELQEKYIKKELDSDGINALFDSMKLLFKLYYKPLRQVMKDKGLDCQLPVLILKQAEKSGMIDDATLWLNFLGDLNAHSQASDEKVKSEIQNGIIEHYHEQMYSALKYIDNEENKALQKKFEELWNGKDDEEINLDYSHPNYSALEIGISDRSYKILMDYFESNFAIKNVWVYGSRAYKNCVKGSDIDIIIDCPSEDFNVIKKGIRELVIPYYIDCKCLNLDAHKSFISIVLPRGHKHIYSLDTAKVFWGNKDLQYKMNSINISKFI